MYSLKSVLTREPAAIVAVVTAWMSVAVTAGWVTWDAKVVAGVEGAVLATLLLLYVRPSSTPNVKVAEQVETAKSLQQADITNFLLQPPDPEPDAAQKVAAAKPAKKSTTTTRSKT